MTTKTALVPPVDPVQQARDEQTQIIALVTRMMGRRDRAGLLDDVRALAVMLPAHFWTEEIPGGVLSEALKRTPNAELRIAALRADHAEILHVLEQLHAELEAEQDGILFDRMEDAAYLAALVEEHEDRESKLLADLVYDDETGGAD